MSSRRFADRGCVQLHLADLLAGLSHALDITEGHAPGHAERSCVLGMRIAAGWGLPEEQRGPLYYALLLKDAGCSLTAAPLADAFGNDDQAVKAAWREDGDGRVRNALLTWRNAAPGRPLTERLGRLRAIATTGGASIQRLTELRCERGAEVVRDIGLPEPAADAVRSLDERWDGSGYPEGLTGEQIPVAARIMSLAQTLEVYWCTGGPMAAAAIGRRRSGRWFDPALVATADALGDALWEGLEEPDVRAIEPPAAVIAATEQRLGAVAAAFARIVDAKSPYTAHHSRGVAELAQLTALELGLAEADATRLYRAGQLHDLGKLGTSNRILDKPGRLTPDEWAAVRRHPQAGHDVLVRIPALADMARLALTHHERLDGTGYPRGLAGDELELADRILAAADVAEALSADRPYRASLPTAEVIDLLRREAPDKLDADVVEAVCGVLPGWRAGLPAAVPSH